MGLWDSLGGIFSSVGGGLLGQATQQEGTPGYTGYDIITSQTTPAYDYSARGLENLATGQVPQYWQNARPKVKQGMLRNQQQAYYGNPGDRYGAYATGLEAGAITGLGAGRTNKGLRPLAQNYLDESRKIEEFLATQDVSTSQNAERNYLATMGGYKPFQIAPYSVAGVEPEKSQWGNIMGMVPWDQVLGGLGGMFGSTGTTGTNVDYLSGIGQYQGLTYPSQGNYNWSQIGNYSNPSSSGLTNYFNNNYQGYQF